MNTNSTSKVNESETLAVVSNRRSVSFLFVWKKSLDKNGNKQFLRNVIKLISGKTYHVLEGKDKAWKDGKLISIDIKGMYVYDFPLSRTIQVAKKLKHRRFVYCGSENQFNPWLYVDGIKTQRIKSHDPLEWFDI
jgi:hypothetical protein